MRIPLPAFALPIVLLWLIAIPVASAQWHPSFMSYRAFAGTLFVVAGLSSLAWLIAGIRAQRRR